MLEVDVKELRLRWTVDTRSRPGPRQPFISPEFRFRGDRGWSLSYYYCAELHWLYLCPPPAGHSPPFDVAVYLESGAEMSKKTECTDRLTTMNGKCCGWCIWWVSESDFERLDPDFRRDRHLRFLVVLSDGDASVTPTGSDSSASQFKCSVPEAAGPSGSTRSISVQTTLLGNAIPCLDNLSQDLAQLMVEDSHHDVEFLCAGQSIKAHKLIVCRRSPVIASMMSSDMVEGRTGVVKIPDIEPDVFRYLLGYIYSGRMPDLTADLALSLYESGDEYGVLGLARRCSEYLVEHLSSENACRLLVVADAHSGEDFRESVIAFMLDNDIPLSGGDWRDFSDAHPKLANEVLQRFCLKLQQRLRNGSQPSSIATSDIKAVASPK